VLRGLTCDLLGFEGAREVFCCEQWAEFAGERVGRLGRGGVHRGSSRSKDALRMTARTDNGKAEADSSAALRNDKQKEQATANAGFFATLRMTTRGGYAQDDCKTPPIAKRPR